METTFQDIKNEVAQKWGLKDFQELKSQGRPDLENFFNKCGELLINRHKEEIEHLQSLINNKNAFIETIEGKN